MNLSKRRSQNSHLVSSSVCSLLRQSSFTHSSYERRLWTTSDGACAAAAGGVSWVAADGVAFGGTASEGVVAVSARLYPGMGFLGQFQIHFHD